MKTHGDICSELTRLYTIKNQDYGDSFHRTYMKYGIVSSLLRLGDKMNRLERLTSGNQRAVKDESIRDTLLDLANYAIMTIMELDNE